MATGEGSGVPFHDIMAATDAVIERPDIDASRTAAMGASFGGCLTNWIATQTGRFKALISHAGVWNTQLRTVSDVPWFFRQAYDDVGKLTTTEYVRARMPNPERTALDLADAAPIFETIRVATAKDRTVYAETQRTSTEGVQLAYPIQ